MPPLDREPPDFEDPPDLDDPPDDFARGDDRVVGFAELERPLEPLLLLLFGLKVRFVDELDFDVLEFETLPR